MSRPVKKNGIVKMKNRFLDEPVFDEKQLGTSGVISKPH